MSHRLSRLLALGVVFAFFLPMVLRGEIIFAHDNSLEVGLRPATDGRASNRKFSDQSSVFLPEIHHQLNGDSDRWISTWNPYPELGRPTNHVSSFSKAYHLFHLLSLAVDDALLLYACLTVAAVALTTLFGHLLLEALGLSAAACFFGALGLGLGIFPAYWLTFVLFIWTIAWTLGCLWLTTLYVRRPTLLCGLGLAFCVHSLLLSGYPQQIVWNAYLLAGYGAYRLWVSCEDARETARIALGIAASVAVGLAASAPVYLDLALNAVRSARVDPGPDFFLAVLPRLADWRDFATFCGQVYDAFWFGNPIGEGYPLRFNGISVGPLYAILAFASLAAWRSRRLWPVQIFCGLAFLANVSPAVYRLGVEYAGLNISRFNPLAGAYIPITILAAYGADEVLRRPGRGRVLSLGLGLLPVLVAAVAIAVARAPIHTPFVAVGLAFTAAAIAFQIFPRPLALGLLSVAAVFHYAYRLPLTRPAESVRLSSPLVESIRNATTDGSRFAWIGRSSGLPLPSNQEALLGIPSVHTYNSLSSKRYQAWVKRISDQGTQTYGRYFRTVTGEKKIVGPEFDYAGIGLVFCQTPLDPERVVEVTPGVYRARERPLLEMQITEFARIAEDRVEVNGTPRSAGLLPLERLAWRDDKKLLRLTAHDSETLLFLSQQHHPHWRASVGGSPVPSVLVNDFYLGALIPAGTQEVELSFAPYALWSWIPQAFFAVGGIALACLRLRRR